MHLRLKLNNEIRIEFCEWYRLERRIQRARRENDLSCRKRKTGMPRTRSYDSVRGKQTDMRIDNEPSIVDVAVKYPRLCHVVVVGVVSSTTLRILRSWFVSNIDTLDWSKEVVHMYILLVCIWIWTFRECGHGLSEGFGFWVSYGTSSHLLGVFTFMIWKDNPETFKAYLLDKYT